MLLADINPFLRFAQLQSSVMSTTPYNYSYDYRIFYIIEGTASFIIGDEAFRVSSGTLIYFRPATPYYFDGRVKVIVLNFDMTRSNAERKKALTPARSAESFKHELIFENEPPAELERFIIIKGAEELGERLHSCLGSYCFPTPTSDAATSALLKELICDVVQRSSEHKDELPELVQKISLYVQQNYDKALSNDQISAEFGYHSYYLNRIFKKYTKTTLHQSLILERLRNAKRLLRNTDMSVSSVAEEVGFIDKAQMCAVFRKQLGITPTEYRKSRTHTQ